MNPKRTRMMIKKKKNTRRKIKKEVLQRRENKKTCRIKKRENKEFDRIQLIRGHRREETREDE